MARAEQWTISHIAKVAGTSPQAVHNWRRRYAEFPQPDPSTGKYDAQSVQEWLQRTGRLRPDLQDTDGWPALTAALQPFDGTVAVFALTSVLDMAEFLERRNAERSGDAIAAAVCKDVHDYLDDDDFEQVQTAVRAVCSSPGLDWLLRRADGETLYDHQQRVIDEFVENQAGDRGSDPFDYSSSELREILAVLAQPEGRVLDPCAGSGSLLYALDSEAEHNNTSLSLFASSWEKVEVETLWRRVNARSLDGRSDGRGTVEWHNVLDTDSGFIKSEFADELFDRVVIDPPFGLWQKNDSQAVTNDDFRWINYCANHLTTDGIGIVVTPDSLLGRAGASQDARVALLRAGAVRAVITFPASSRLRPQLHAIWVLRAPSPEHQASPLTVVEAEGDTATMVRQFQATGELMSESFARRIKETWLAAESDGFATDPLGISAARISVDDALLLEANLRPKYWVTRAARRDPAQEVELLNDALTNLLEDHAVLAKVGPPNLTATPGSPPAFELLDHLVSSGRLRLIRGKKHEEGIDAPGLVRAKELQRGHFSEPLDRIPVDKGQDVTRPNTVVLMPSGRIRAAIDRTGGHVLDAPLIGIEITEAENRITPEILQQWLHSDEVRALADRSGAARLDLKQLSIPLFDPASAQQLTHATAAIVEYYRLADAARRSTADTLSTLFRAATVGADVTARPERENRP